MNQAEFEAEIAAGMDIAKSEASKLVDGFLAAVTRMIARGEQEIRFAGWGTFAAATRAPKRGRNPQTGAPLEIAAKRVVKFRPGRELQRAAEANGEKRAA